MPYEISLGGTGSVTAAGARKKLGLEVGTDIQPYDSDLQALADNSGTGFWSVTGSGTGSTRTIQGTANQIAVTNSGGVSGNPVISLTSSITISGTMTAGSFSGTSGTFGGVTVDSNRVYRTVDDSGFTIFGGTVNNGANIELYGGTHASLANRAYYDADLHTFRRQDATSGTSFVVNGTVTATSFSGNGSALTSLNASNISSGTLDDTRLSFTVSAFAKTILDDADATSVRSTIGLVIGTDVQAHDILLDDLAGISFSQGDILYYNGSNLVALSPGTSGDFLQTQGAGANPQWAVGASGDVVGPASSTNNNIALFDGTTGKLIKDGGTLASIATSGSAADLTTGILPAARFNDTAHGNRGGGSLHAAATTGAAGFMSSSDKTKLDGLGAPITSGTAQSTTSGTAKDFTGIPPGTTMIIVDFDEVTLDGSENVLVQIGDSGGLEASGYTSGSTITTHSGGGGGVTSSAGLIVYQQSANRGFLGHMLLLNITGNAWTSSHSGLRTEAGNDDAIIGGGRKVLSATLDRIRVTRTGSASFNAGQVNIHYV